MSSYVCVVHVYSKFLFYYHIACSYFLWLLLVGWAWRCCRIFQSHPPDFSERKSVYAPGLFHINTSKDNTDNLFQLKLADIKIISSLSCHVYHQYIHLCLWLFSLQGKLVVGHNMFMDLVHLLHRFCSKLPEVGTWNLLLYIFLY